MCMKYLVNFKIKELDRKNGNLIYKVYAMEDAYSIKDTLKDLGFRWNDGEWSKEVTDAQIRECLDQVEEAGIDLYWSLDQYLEREGDRWYDAQNTWKENIVSKIDSLVEPVMPKFFVGKKWNKSFYRKKGARYAYLDGQKVSVTDQQEQEIEQYYKDLFNCKQAVDQIINHGERYGY